MLQSTVFKKWTIILCSCIKTYSNNGFGWYKQPDHVQLFYIINSFIQFRKMVCVYKMTHIEVQPFAINFRWTWNSYSYWYSYLLHHSGYFQNKQFNLKQSQFYINLFSKYFVLVFRYLTFGKCDSAKIEAFDVNCPWIWWRYWAPQFFFETHLAIYLYQYGLN